MAAETKIEWCDHTFNPWRGCVHATLADDSPHPGCDHCYAETMSKRNPKALGVWGADGARVMAAPAYWKQPLKWNREAEAAGERRRVFCASLADVFEDWTGPILDSKGSELFIEPNSGNLYNREIHEGCNHLTMNDLRRQLFALIDQTPNLDWLVLTKRPQNVRRMWPAVVRQSENWFFDEAERKARGLDKAGPHKGTLTVVNGDRRNVWLITSVSDQVTADAAIPELLKLRDLTPVLGLSCEPLLGPVDLMYIAAPETSDGYLQPISPRTAINCMTGGSYAALGGGEVEYSGNGPLLNWVIVGGESGKGARPCNLAWIRSIVEQCKASGTACFVKQLGAHVRADIGGRDGFEWPEGTMLSRDPVDDDERARFALRDPKGGDWSEWPKDLRVREFPESVAAAAAGGWL